MLANLIKYNDQYIRIIMFFGIPKQEFKDQTGTIIPTFSILINTNTFVIRLSPKKITKVIKTIVKNLAQKSLTFRETLLLGYYFSYCTKVVKLRWVFICLSCLLVTSYPQKVKQSDKKRLLKEIWNNFI